MGKDIRKVEERVIEKSRLKISELIENSSSPFLFIFGPHRSGTTFLVNLLKLSDSISFTPNDFDLMRIYHYFLGKNEKNSRQRKRLRSWEITRSPIVNYFLNEKKIPTNELFPYVTSPVAILRTVLTSYFKMCMKPLMIHKTPKSEHYLDTYREAFPGSKFVFMVRNPLGIMSSRKYWTLSNKNSWVDLDPMNEKIDMDLAGSSINYMKTHLDSMFQSFKIIDEASFSKETFAIVPYEKLVNETESVLRDFGERLGIKFNLCGIKDLKWPYTSYKVFRKSIGVYSGAIDMWKKRLTKMEITIIHNEFRKFLKDDFENVEFKNIMMGYKKGIEDFLNKRKLEESEKPEGKKL